MRPLDDVDLLAAQLAADDLDARAPQADAGADRIDVALGGGHGDLRPLTRFAGGRLHHHDALLDLGNLRLEQAREISGMRARQRDLWSLGAPSHLEHECADAITGVESLTGDLLTLGQDRLGLADLDDDVTLLDAVDDASQDLAVLALELLEDAVALGVPHALQDHLLGRLGGDATELLRR